jgi:hypothetical protein
MNSASSGGRKFDATLLGQVVQCDCVADALVIRFADHALTSPGECLYDPPTLLKIAAIVEHYGHAAVAERLVAMARTQRPAL